MEHKVKAGDEVSEKSYIFAIISANCRITFKNIIMT